MAELDVLAVLKGAREILGDPARWTQGTSARDDAGRDLVDLLEEEYDTNTEADVAACVDDAAACWCLGGAITRVAGESVRYDDPRFEVLWKRVENAVGPWNDSHGHEDVLSVLDESIEEVEGARAAA